MKYSLRSLFVGITLLAIAFAYFGSYVRRSNRGMYEPAVVGADGVKWYDWAPEGLVEGYRWDTPAMWFYYPLWRMDRRFWHPPLRAGMETTYPIADRISAPASSASAPNPPKP